MSAEDGIRGGELLRALRHRAGLTQDGLAELAGLHTRTIRGLETGRIVTPRRSSLDLLAQALSLDVRGSLALLAAWGIHDTSVPASRGAPTSDDRIAVIEAFLAESQRTMRTVTLNELVVIGADRRTVRRETQEVAVALVDGVDSRSIFYDPTDDAIDIDRFHLSELENCRVERELKDPMGRAKLFELGLNRSLDEGETQLIHYSADFAAARGEQAVPPVRTSEEIAGFMHSPVSYVLEVRFHESAPPTRCAQIYQSRPTGPMRTVGTIALTSTNAVHLALVNPMPGGHGVAWGWDR